MNNIQKILRAYLIILLLVTFNVRIFSQPKINVDSLHIIFTQYTKDSTIINETCHSLIDYSSLGIISYNNVISIAAKKDSFIVKYLYKIELTRYQNNNYMWMLSARNISKSRFIGLNILHPRNIITLWTRYRRSAMIGKTRYLWIKGNGKKAGKIGWYRKERTRIYEIFL
jgi:hypothetical protein